MTHDPLSFAVGALEERGALVELGGDEALAMLPPALVAELELSSEIVRIALSPVSPAIVACGFGTPLLEKLISSACAGVVGCAARLRTSPSRAQQARALAEKFAARNAVAEVLDVSSGEGTYVSAWLSFRAEAEDRHEGLVSIVLRADDGAKPDDSFATSIDPIANEGHLEPVDYGASTISAATARFLAARAEAAVARECAPFFVAVARRHGRDYAQTKRYFTELIREARHPKRRVDRATMEEKVAHLERERDAKLRDLTLRFSTSVSANVCALLFARAPEAIVRGRIRRRKESREIQLRFPAGSRALAKLACDGCFRATSRPAFCDDALHVLCEECLPNAQGRPNCRACARD